MNGIQIFKNENFGEIRVAEVDGEPWFCAIDITKVLGYSNGRDAVSKHCRKEGVAKRDGVSETTNQYGITTKQNVQLTYINEGNLYRLITHSKLPSAEQFEIWVFDEVLPSIRKHGLYATPTKVEDILNNPDSFIKILQAFKQERQAKEIAENQLKLQAPKVEYYDEVLSSENTYTTSQIAKELGIGAPTLNQKLKELHVQYKQNGSWLLYFKYQNKGYTKSQTLTFKDKDGKPITKLNFKWTEKGREFIHKLIKNAA